MRISIAIVRALVEELDRRGLDGVRCATDAGLEAALLEDATELIDMGLYARIVDTALERSGDPRLGLRVGKAAPAAALHLVGHLAVACRTLREASELFLRYTPLLLEGARFDLRVEGETAIFSYRHPVIPAAHRAYDAEYCLSVIHGIASGFRRGLAADEVRFVHGAPEDDSLYREVFGCPVRFGCEENAIAFDAAYLDVRQPHSDPPLLALLKQRADALLAEREAPERLPTRIRDLVRTVERPNALDTLVVAEAIGLGERTLRRQLARSGWTVRDLVEDTMCEMATTMLVDGGLPIKEVAYRLGFSEPSAFHRAFKRWTGKTPAELRGRVRSTPPPAFEPVSGERSLDEASALRGRPASSPPPAPWRAARRA